MEGKGTGSAVVALTGKRREGAGVWHGTFQGAWKVPAPVCFRGMGLGTGAGRRHKSHRLQMAGASDTGCPHAAALGHTLLLIIVKDS